MLDRRSDPRRPYSCGDIAAALGKSSYWFYEHRKELELTGGMPAPLPGSGHPKWAADKIEAWLAGRAKQGAMLRTAANDAAPVAAPEFDAWQAAAEAEYRIARPARAR